MSNLLKVWCWRDRLYRIHVVTGLAAAVWFLLMAVSGVLINHQESLGLLDAEVSDRYLPGYYRADARTGTTRLNILITDLHSGRIFGSQGHWVSDIVAGRPIAGRRRAQPLAFTRRPFAAAVRRLAANGPL